MNSTLISKVNDKKILEINNLNLFFQVRKYRTSSFRDTFVDLCNSPVDFFMSQRQGLHLLRDVNLSLGSGDRIALLGVNGSGKTSLCRHISGMHGKLSEVKINGTIKSVFNTEVGVLPELSGRENAKLLTTLMYPELSSDLANELVEEAIAFCELGEFIDTSFQYYSKGMKVRLFLSIVAARPTDLLILDEVFDGADIFFNEKVTKKMMEMIEDSGAVIFVSHSFDQIKNICNKGAVLHDGQISFLGNVDDAISFYKENCSGS